MHGNDFSNEELRKTIIDSIMKQAWADEQQLIADRAQAHRRRKTNIHLPKKKLPVASGKPRRPKRLSSQKPSEKGEFRLSW